MKKIKVCDAFIKKIWEQGYFSGKNSGHTVEDVAAAWSRQQDALKGILNAHNQEHGGID